MAANQISLSSPTQIDFSFSPYMEKPAQYDTFFNDSSVAQHNDRTSLLHNFLSPTSPNPLRNSGSFANSDIDHVFAELIANTQLSSVVSLGGAQDERVTSAGLVHHHQQQISEVVPLVQTTEKAASKLLAPLVIPDAAQLLPAAVALPANDCVEENGRQWQTVFVEPAFANLVQVSVTSKTRCEEPCSEVPDKLYSSLKYEIRQQAVGAACSMVPFLLGRITVVDAADFSEILKDKKSVLKGTVEGSLVRPPVCQESENKLEGSLKVQFTDVSYHHKKKGFCFQISYYVPSDLEHPILIKRSASFMVFARKPNQNKKRKKNEPSENFEQFCARLEDLVSCSKKLKPMEKQNALSLVSNKLLQMDPAFFIAQLQQQVQQPNN